MPKDHNMAADQICKKVTDSQNVYSNVYLNKKTNHPNVTPSGWLSTVDPVGIEPVIP
jgi:hypothetical protein